MREPWSNGSLGPPSFHIVVAERLKYGSLVAAATIAVSGFGKFEICVFAPQGKSPFAKPRSVGDDHKRTFWLEPAFADAICAAVLERLDIVGTSSPPKAAQPKSEPETKARRKPRRPSRPAPSTPARFATTAERDEFLERQEQAFEQRFRAL